jgi:transposase
MEIIGIDVHKKESQLCILADNGEVIEKRIRTERGRFAEVFGSRPKARILIEASTESEWVARCLEALGHEVIVADPSYAPMYATRSRRVKTDRRDARTLADACATGGFRRAHRLSNEQRHMRTVLGIRENLVETRTKFVNAISTVVRREGLRIGTGTTAHFLERLARVPLTEGMKAEISPLVEVLRVLDKEIEHANESLAQRAEQEPEAKRLCTAPGVGPVVAATFISVVDGVQRFRGAHQLEAYLGVVPGERSSGEKQHRGRITKMGNRRMRGLLIQSALSILHSRRAHARGLREWAERIGARRGKQIALVALSRKLTGILYAMMRDESDFKAPTGVDSSKSEAA